MSGCVPLPPPGFDDLTVDEKVEYVQLLWDRIGASDEEVPVPAWHREVLRERLRDFEAHPDKSMDWQDVRRDLERELRKKDADQ